MLVSSARPREQDCVSVAILIVLGALIVIYLHLYHNEYGTHEMWQYRILYHLPQVSVTLSIVFEAVAAIVIALTKRKLGTMNASLKEELAIRRRIVNRQLQKQMEVNVNLVILFTSRFASERIMASNV